VKLLPVLTLLPLFALPVPMATAQTQVLAQCVALSDDAERLACYDGLFRNAGPEAAALSVVIESEQLIPARPSGRQPATMTISCSADVLTIAFAFAGNTMSALGRDAGLTLQSDLQPARSRTLPVNDTNTAIVLDNTRDSAALLDGLAGTTNLTARVTPVNSRSLSVRFRVDAIMTEVEPVRAACGV
jgi:hypothetical protein